MDDTKLIHSFHDYNPKSRFVPSKWERLKI